MTRLQQDWDAYQVVQTYRMVIKDLIEEVSDQGSQIHALQKSEEGYADRIAELEAENKELRDFKNGKVTL